MNELQRLTLAFRLHVAEQIVGADSTVHPQEAAHLKFLFPEKSLQEAGFVDGLGNRTDAHAEAAMEALEVLPEALSDADKIALLSEFMGAVLADGAFDREEGVALVGAAHLLELPEHLIQDFLDAHLAVGGLQVDDLS